MFVLLAMPSNIIANTLARTRIVFFFQILHFMQYKVPKLKLY